MIVIYDDSVHNHTGVYIALQSVGYDDISFCTASMVPSGCLDTQKLLIMPGGADLYCCEKLNGEGNQRIRDFVASGGSYLGICAGAYYGCSQLDWACGEISGDRELGFYSGKATGPVYEWVENKDEIYSGSWIKAVEIETSNGQKFLSQYNGGPVFDHRDCDVIARYTELEGSPPAIVGADFGKGKYILSSPHIENFGHLLVDGLYKHLNKSYNREAKEIDRLLGHEQAQKDFFKEVIERLL